MVVEVVDFELHPICRSAVPSTTAKKTPSSTRRLRAEPTPTNPTPKNGKSSAKIGPRCSRPEVVVTRAVVEIASVRLCAPPLMFGMGLLVNVQVEPEGNPEPQASETDSGKPAPVGVTLTEKFTCPPEGMVLLVLGGARLALTEKSFTGTEPLMLASVPPGKLRDALLPTELVPCSGVAGAGTVTVTTTWVAGEMLLLAPHELGVVNVVMEEVLIVPSVQLGVPVLPVF